MVKYEVDPGGKFRKAVQEAINQVGDLTIPFKLITRQWYQSNKAIFTLQGTGKYEDYKVNKNGVSAYKQLKIKQKGSAYPMLVGIDRKGHSSGQLRDSLIDPGNAKTIAQILNGKALILGTSVSYAPYHQFGTRFMAQRPVLFIGAEQTAPPQLSDRREAWINTIQAYVSQVMKQKVGKN